jgi:hypothetical protein
MRSTRLAMITLLAVLLAGCGPGETPEQHLERLRLAHEITPVGYTTIRTPDGQPVTVVDLRVVNHSDEPLDHLTVMVRVVGPDGTIIAERRATLDLSGARPGVGIQTAAQVPGLEVTDQDQVQVELESGLAPEVLHALPEWSDVSRKVS